MAASALFQLHAWSELRISWCWHDGWRRRRRALEVPDRAGRGRALEQPPGAWCQTKPVTLTLRPVHRLSVTRFNKIICRKQIRRGPAQLGLRAVPDSALLILSIVPDSAQHKSVLSGNSTLSRTEFSFDSAVSWTARRRGKSEFAKVWVVLSSESESFNVFYKNLVKIHLYLYTVVQYSTLFYFKIARLYVSSHHYIFGPYILFFPESSQGDISPFKRKCHEILNLQFENNRKSDKV